MCDLQGKIKDAFDAAGIVKGLSNAMSHRLRDTFAVELLLAGFPLERVAVLLGHQSIKITEKPYAVGLLAPGAARGGPGRGMAFTYAATNASCVGTRRSTFRRTARADSSMDSIVTR